MQNVTTGGSQRYGYDAIRSPLDDRRRPQQRRQRAHHPGYDQRSTSSSATWATPRSFPARRPTTPLAAGATDLLSFRFDQSELDSTATDSVILRVLVQGTDGVFIPGVPTIAGLTPLSVNTRGSIVVALFLINQPGLYVVAITGAKPTTTGNYSLNLNVAGDLNGDGIVDGNDSALLRRRAQHRLGRHRLQPGRRHKRRWKRERPG